MPVILSPLAAIRSDTAFCAVCRSVSMSVMVCRSFTLPPVSFTAWATPLIRNCVLASTLLPVRWTRVPRPPMASIAAFEAL